MRGFLMLAVTFVGANLLNAAELTIFDVRKPIAMSDKDKPQKDFYINGGSESGLQTNTIVTVVRKLPLYDSYQNKSAGDLTVPVAKILVIHVQQGLSVARFHSEIGRGDIPVLDENYIVAGDKLDLATVSRNTGKKTASNDGEPSDSAVPAAAPAVLPSPTPTAAEPEKAETPPVSVQEPMPAPTTAQMTSEKMDLPTETHTGISSTEAPAIQ